MDQNIKWRNMLNCKISQALDVYSNNKVALENAKGKKDKRKKQDEAKSSFIRFILLSLIKTSCIPFESKDVVTTTIPIFCDPGLVSDIAKEIEEELECQIIVDIDIIGGNYLIILRLEI